MLGLGEGKAKCEKDGGDVIGLFCQIISGLDFVGHCYKDKLEDESREHLPPRDDGT